MPRLLLLFSVFCLSCASTPQKSKSFAPSDPLATGCEGGSVKSCLMAADSAERAGNTEKALSYYTRACDLGESTGCLLAGGLLVTVDRRDDGLELLERACKEGEPAACHGAGLVLNGDLGGESNPELAFEAFEKACDAGLITSCGKVALAYLLGNGTELDKARGLKELDRTCSKGDAASCFHLGQARDSPKDANPAFERACTEGDGRGCTALGFAYAQGSGVKIDPEASRTYFERGCHTLDPDPRSCTMLGWSQWQGIGGETEREEGEKKLISACDVDGLACYYLARIQAQAGDVDASQKSLKKACEKAPQKCDWFSDNIDSKN